MNGYVGKIIGFAYTPSDDHTLAFNRKALALAGMNETWLEGELLMAVDEDRDFLLVKLRAHASEFISARMSGVNWDSSAFGVCIKMGEVNDGFFWSTPSISYPLGGYPL